MVSPADFLFAINRVRTCYSEDPGLSARVTDLARLSGISVDVCAAAVIVLDKEGFLHRRRDDVWVLAAGTEATSYR